MGARQWSGLGEVKGGEGGGASRRELGEGSMGAASVDIARGDRCGAIRKWVKSGVIGGGWVGCGVKSTGGSWKGLLQRIVGKGGWMVWEKSA